MVNIKTCLHKPITFIAILSLVFEQSPLNEALRALFGFRAFQLTNNALFVGLVVALLTLVIELTSSILIAAGLNSSVKFKAFLNRHTPTRNGRTSYTVKNSAADYLLALGIGAGSLVIIKHLKNRDQVFLADLKSAFKASCVIAVFSGFVGFLAGGGIVIAQDYGLADQAQYFLDIVTDWRFWLIIVLVSQGGEFLKRRWNKT